jgi:hypothetical protein
MHRAALVKPWRARGGAFLKPDACDSSGARRPAQPPRARAPDRGAPTRPTRSTRPPLHLRERLKVLTVPPNSGIIGATALP